MPQCQIHAVPERIWKSVEPPTRGSECWAWVGCKDGDGYGMAWFAGRSQRVHRIIFGLLRGAIPSNLECDHLCRNPSCVNPWHIEPVTRRTNVLRGIGFAARNAIKTHCPHGHAYTETNIKIDHGRRRCRTCYNAYQRLYYWRQR